MNAGIRILQPILLKICLMLGVKVHPGVTFESLIEPKDIDSGWSVAVSPASSPVLSVNYDIILAADGKKNSLPGFHSKEFRAKLALAITTNFVRHNTRAESIIPELGGVSFMFKQQFFKDMAKELDIDLENIVYFKDEMHYFVMTAKKQSLLKRGVLKEVRPLHIAIKDTCNKYCMSSDWSLIARSLYQRSHFHRDILCVSQRPK